MSWEDTVLVRKQEYYEQAKASYEAGIKEGRREVVEWIKSHSIGVTADNELKDNSCWKSKLEEWGIE